jgi:hypothetical protein
MAVDRTQDMEKEFSKTPGGNYFNYVDTPKLERLGITQYKPGIGENAIRIIYPPNRPGFYGLEIYRHSNVGVNRKTFLCKKKMFNEPCPVCDYTDLLRKDDPQDERAKALYTGRRYLFFAVDVISDDAISKGIRWWDCPIGIYNEIKSRSKNKRRGRQEEGEEFRKYVDVSHPSDGRDIEFEQTKVKGKYGYEGITLIATDPIPEDWYNDLPEFADILKMSTVEEMEEACNGEDVPDKVEEDTSEREESKNKEVKKEEVKTEETPRGEEKEEEEGTRRSFSSRRSSRGGESAQEEESDLKDRVRSRVDRAKAARRTSEE